MENTKTNSKLDAKTDAKATHAKTEPSAEHTPEAHAHHAHATHHEHTTHAKTFGPVHIALAVLIGVVLLFNAYQLSSIGTPGTTPAPVLPKISITLLSPIECKDCFDLKSVYTELLKGKTYTVSASQELAITDAHAQRLATENNITQLPAIVIEGDTTKLSLQGTRKSGNNLVLDTPAPYYDIKEARVKGKVSITYIVPDAGTCDKCANITLLGAQLKQAGVVITSENTYPASSDDGKRLIATYALTKLPGVILSSDAGAYELITQTWSQVGDVAPDGNYILRTLSPPYYDLTTHTVKGLVNLVNLVDASCTTCYNVSLHKPILAGFGIAPATEKTVDVSSDEGKTIIAANNIEMVPTIILTGDPQLYPALQQVWPQVGTALNNVYVFRHTELLPGMTSKNLTSGKLVTPPAPTS